MNSADNVMNYWIGSIEKTDFVKFCMQSQPK